MYGANSEKDLVQVPVSSGKHENVKITEFTTDRTQSGTLTLLVKFQTADGKAFQQRFFPVNAENIRKNISKFRGQSAEQVIEDQTRRVSAQITHILSAFVPKQNIFFTADTWEEYIEKVVEIAGTNYESELFRCKLVYNKSGYIEFPRSTVRPFFENMKEKDNITINPKYDNITPPAATDEDSLEPNAEVTDVDLNVDSSAVQNEDLIF